MIDLSSTDIRFLTHGGADSGGGLAGTVEGILGFIEGLLVLSPAQLFARVMPGISAMDNLHPLFVHFPIALLFLFFVLDSAGSLFGKSDYRRAAGWFLYSGAIFAGLTVIMGFVAAASVPHGGDVHEIMEHHQKLGLSVFGLACVLAIWRFLAKGGIAGAANTLYIIFAVIMTVLLTFTADLGGLMVYKYGVAVEPVAELNKEAAARHQHGDATISDDLDHDDIHDDETMTLEHHHDHIH
ncbi:MAG: DUF2231 domain-containing protein [Gammaproteobacteria bacterium]